MRHIKWMGISKVMFVIFLIYREVLSASIFAGNSGLIMWGLLGITLITALLGMNFHLPLFHGLPAYTIFIIYSFATGMLVAVDREYVTFSTMEYVVCLFVFFLICAYTQNDGSINFVADAFIIMGLVTVAVCLSRGMSFQRISISDSVNTNKIGTIMTFSIAFLLFRIIKMKRSFLYISTSIVVMLLFAFVLVLTVSKKSIFAGIFLIATWFLVCYRKIFQKRHPILRYTIFILLIVVIAISSNWFINKYMDRFSYLLTRMSELESGNSSIWRRQLISDAIKTFLQHPVIGVGLNNCRYYTNIRMYSHCFYTEVLACTGIIGTIIFIAPIISTGKYLMTQMREMRNNDTLERAELLFLNIIFLTLLFTSIAQIIFYSIQLMYVLAVIIAYCQFACFSSEREKSAA